ncbi:transcriptional regulator [Shewanella algae]|uniref:transcriptional regulator n=1 Tax=Shewanella algae TaxID=38313 RepID=UPI0031F49F82
MTIRSETLAPASEWQQATGPEVKEAMKLAGLTGEKLSEILGVDKKGRTVRKWCGYTPEKIVAAKIAGKKPNVQPISYAAWAILAELAGFGQIWRK